MLRAHDLRGTFVTISLANGRSETWVADRTGHKSSQMINRWRCRCTADRQTARTAAELNLGTFDPLDAAIPELGLPQDCPTAPTMGDDGGRDPGGFPEKAVIPPAFMLPVPHSNPAARSK